MAKKICLAQTVEELKYILSKVDDKVICVPLDLSTHLYCIRKKIIFYNPNDFIDCNFHRDSLIESEKLINKLDFGNLKYESIKKIYSDEIRYKFNVAVFLIELVKKINSHEKIDEIIISGWNRNFSKFSSEYYFISYLLFNLITDIKIVRLLENEKIDFFSNYKIKYLIKNRNLNNKKKYILQNGLSYNFSRILFYFRKKNFIILIPSFDSHLKKKFLDFLKRKVLRLFNVIFVDFRSIDCKDQLEINIPDINFFYKGKDLSVVLNFRKNQLISKLIKIKNMCDGIDLLFNKVKIQLVLSNNATGVDGYCVEKSKKIKIPSIIVPHGTIAEHFDEFDKIFKKNLAVPHFTKDAEFFALQSKIFTSFAKANKVENHCIETGNLLFNNEKRTSKKKILFANTLKSLQNIKYLGVEMYYEYLENLDLLNDIAKKGKFHFLIKPHPSVNYCFDDLKNQFKNLEFTKKKISHALKQSFATISFSSTVIEDSLYSNVPVILFDRWKRYKHCKAEEDVKKLNSAIYYVNKEEDLINCVNTIKKSDKILFEEYIFNGNVKSNVNQLMHRILN